MLLPPGEPPELKLEAAVKVTTTTTTIDRYILQSTAPQLGPNHDSDDVRWRQLRYCALLHALLRLLSSDPLFDQREELPLLHLRLRWDLPKLDLAVQVLGEVADTRKKHLKSSLLGMGSSSVAQTLPPSSEVKK